MSKIKIGFHLNGITGVGFDYLRFEKDGKTWFAVSFEGFDDSSPGYGVQGTTAIFQVSELMDFLTGDLPELSAYRHEYFVEDVRRAVEDRAEEQRKILRSQQL